MDEDDSPLQITPSFKQRSKGKSRSSATLRTPVDSPAASGDERDPSKTTGEEDDLDEGNSSAILFRKSGKSGKGRSSGLGASTSSSSSSSKKPPLQAGGASRSKLNLSFGPAGAVQDVDDDDNDEDAETSFSNVVRKNDSSRKLKRPPNLPGAVAGNGVTASARNLSQSMSQASISPSLAGSTAQLAGPSYSKDYLAELKAANTSTPSSLARTSNGNGGGQYDDLTMSKFGNGAMAADDSETLLPTENAIASAKARRETARRLGIDNPMTSSGSTSSDFISLQVGLPSSSNRESRLVREEDELGEGEDEHSEFTGATERIPLGKKGKASLEKRRKEELRGMIDDVMGEEEEGDMLGLEGENEEAREWEMAQIRRGEQRNTREGDGDGEKAPYRAAPIPEASALPSLMSVSSRLQATLQEARSSKAENDELLAHALSEREGLETQEKELRNEVERVNAKYEWFVEFKDWIEDVATFLDEKFPKLEKIEVDNVSVQRERLDLIKKRRFQDDSDDVASFTGVAIPVTWSNEVARGNDDMEVDAEVDEMGRSRREDNLEPKSYARKTRREERKKRRVQLVHGQSDQGTTATAEGYETDDTLLSSDSQDLIAAKEALSSDLTSLFFDVQAEEFKDPSLGIRPKFEDWKHRYPEEYGNAFASLAMVGVWEFWARTELATWNPFGIPELQDPGKGLDGYKWHEALLAFQHARAMSAGEEGEEHGNSEDDVVNGMVATVIVPRLRKLAMDAYDPYSSVATSRALAIVEEITYCLETSHTRFEYLVLGFISRFQVAIYRLQSLVQPHLKEIRSPLGAIDMDSIEARNQFFQRCLKLLNNGLRWRRYTKGIVLPAGVGEEGIGAGLALEAALAKELVGKVMLPVLEAAWETGGSDISRTVISSFPPNSLPADLSRRLSRS